MSCEIKVCCVFEPIHGRLPDKEMCDRHKECIGCSYHYEKIVEEEKE